MFINMNELPTLLVSLIYNYYVHAIYFAGLTYHERCLPQTRCVSGTKDEMAVQCSHTFNIAYFTPSYLSNTPHTLANDY